jgi:phenylacetate-CoA ligase
LNMCSRQSRKRSQTRERSFDGGGREQVRRYPTTGTRMVALKWRYRSSVAGIQWPALPGRRGAGLMAALQQLESSQWWPEAKLREHQYEQLEPLLAHAYRTVPHYRRAWRAFGRAPRPGTDAWLRLPLLTRHDLNDGWKNLVSEAIPSSHGRTRVVHTSGSTGVRATTLATDITRFFWDVFTLRDHAWHERDLSGKLAIIRYLANGKAIYPDVMDVDGWGCAAGELAETGPARLINVLSPMQRIGRWLTHENPDYLLIYPSALDELLCRSAELDIRLPALREVRTLSEVVTPETRSASLDQWGAKLVDLYSTIEAGYIALQCPDHPHYHVQSEGVLVEILDEEGKPCEPGETGRVVITTLHNYATPLIRYELGDMAVAGAPCPCGRGLPVIERILGRYRNLLTSPNGERMYPEFTFSQYADRLPVEQMQVVQTGPADLEVRVVLDRELTESLRRAISQQLKKTLHYPFNLEFKRVDTVRRSDTGKLEQFVSLL